MACAACGAKYPFKPTAKRDNTGVSEKTSVLNPDLPPINRKVSKGVIPKEHKIKIKKDKE